MSSRRLGFLVALFALLAGLAGYSLFDRMVMKRDDILYARYTDVRFAALMEGLISEGVIKAEAERVTIDEDLLASKNLLTKTQQRVRRGLEFCFMKNGDLRFDRLSVSVLNGRKGGDEIVLRGTIKDRNGIILARSILDEKTWSTKRTYTYGPEFYPVVGHQSPIYGSRHLEKELDLHLRGASHFPVSVSTQDPFKRLTLGDQVTLTIDSEIQRHAYNLMGDKKGAVVVLDVRSGGILAAVSAPSFDPNIAEGSKWRDVFGEREERRWENRAFAALYPPGSTFKTVIASALLDKGDTAAFTLMCTGRKNRYAISDLHTHGRTDLDRAFVVSCNHFFSEAGVRLGPELLRHGEAFGFNRNVDLTPHLKETHYTASTSPAFILRENGKDDRQLRKYGRKDFRANPGLVAQGSIGQNIVMATPLQMAMVAAAVANKGVVLNPHVVKEIRTGDGQRTLFEAKPVIFDKAMRADTSERLKGLMERVMQHGTGKHVKKIYFEDGRYTTSPGEKSAGPVRVAGKTGTAEVGNKKPHSWFIGFAPVDNPRVAIAVVAENQGFGSLVAAPIAMDVIAGSLNRRQAD